MKNAILFSSILFLSTQCLAQTSVDVAARNKATFIKANAAYNEKKLDEATQYYATNFVRKTEVARPGRAGVKTRWEETYKTWPDNKAIIQNIVAEGDWVMVYCKASATHTNDVMGAKPTNKKIEADYWEAIHFDKDGLIMESWSTLDNFAMMKQLGLLPAPPTTPSVKSDEEDIKKVIIDETTAWANHDTTAYFAAYADNELTQGAYNDPDLSFGVYSGFATLQKIIREDIKSNPSNRYSPKVERSNWLIKILSPEWAWVNFMQKMSNVRGQINTSYETRLMHKEGGKWHINVVNAMWDYKNVVQPAVNPDEEDIKKVMSSNTEYWLDGNLEAWSEGFIHEPYLTWSVTNGGEPGDVITTRGWEALKTFMTGWFASDKSALVKEWRKSKDTSDNWLIQIRSNTAYVSFNVHSENEEKKTKSDKTEIRVLEKINGNWKVAVSTTLVDFKDATPPIKSKY